MVECHAVISGSSAAQKEQKFYLPVTVHRVTVHRVTVQRVTVHRVTVHHVTVHHVTVHRNKFLYNKTNQMHQFHKLPTSNRKKPVPYWFCSKDVYKPVLHTPVPNVQ